MTTHREAAFSIDSFDATAYDEPADGPPLGRATLRKTFSGSLTGSSVVEMLTCGQEGYLANERVTGTLDGRAGTFVLQHGSVRGGPNPDGGQSFGYVVPGSGTGELTGLTGVAAVAHGLLTLDYDVG